MEVALENLISNAFKFSAQAPPPCVEVAALDPGAPRPPLASGLRVFYVRDNGQGFEMAHAADLFSPFRRLPGAESFEGSGIGLATVQRIVHRHGGKIWAEATVNGGATFYFTLGDVTEPARSD
jgi:signal transduction histidine kinase